MTTPADLERAAKIIRDSEGWWLDCEKAIAAALAEARQAGEAAGRKAERKAVLEEVVKWHDKRTDACTLAAAKHDGDITDWWNTRRVTHEDSAAHFRFLLNAEEEPIRFPYGELYSEED